MRLATAKDTGSRLPQPAGGGGPDPSPQPWPGRLSPLHTAARGGMGS